MSSDKKDIFQRVTDQIVSAIEAGRHDVIDHITGTTPGRRRQGWTGFAAWNALRAVEFRLMRPEPPITLQTATRDCSRPANFVAPVT